MYGNNMVMPDFFHVPDSLVISCRFLGKKYVTIMGKIETEEFP